MRLGQGVDPLVTQRGEGEAGEALVVGVASAFDEAEVLGPVDETNGAVVPDEEGPGDVGDGRAPAVGVAADGEQELVLGRRHVESGGLLLAETAEAAQRNPELEDPGELFVGRHGRDPRTTWTPRYPGRARRAQPVRGEGAAHLSSAAVRQGRHTALLPA